jgi:hypothetical protein
MALSNTLRTWSWLPAFIAAAFVLFWPTLAWTPFSDDHSALWNAGVRGIPWRTGFFRPLSDSTFRVGFGLFGTATQGHRGFNVLIHGLNAFLLYALCRQWWDMRAGVLAGILFLVYPFHQESIVWLVGRESALGTTSVLLGLVVGGSALPLGLRPMLMAAIMLVGALCYESAMLLLPLALVIAWSRQFNGWPSWRSLVLSLGLGTLAYCVLRSASTSMSGDGYFDSLLPQGPLEFFIRLPKALARLFLPPEPDTTVQVMRGIGLGILLTLLFLLIRRAKELAGVRGRLVLFVVMIVLSSALAMVAGVSTITGESDRYLLLPSAFLCGSIGVLLSRIGRPLIRWGMFAVLIGASLWQTTSNHANWRTASITTRHCIEQLPPIPDEGRLWVSGLPADHRGAFIFRNGFPEAMDLQGERGDHIIVVPSGVTLQQVFGSGVEFRGAHQTWVDGDKWCHWTGEGYSSHLTQ